MKDKPWYIIGFDVGTTSTKGSVLDSDLNIIAGVQTEHRVDYLKPGFVEQNSNEWWEDIVKITRDLSHKVPFDQVRAVGVSSMCPTVLPISSSGEPLRPAILYGIDNRAVEEIEFLNRALATSAPNHIYTLFSSQSILPKLLWLKNNEPETFGQTYSFLTTSSFIVYRLTGACTIDFFTASAANLIDLGSSDWYQEGFEVSGVQLDQLPQLKWSGEVAGSVTRSASQETGLPEGIPVTVGSCDAAAEAVVCGCVSPGNAAVSLGGTTICVACTNTPSHIPNLLVNTHAFPGLYIIGGATSSGGLLLEWFAQNVLQEGIRELFERFSDLEYEPSQVVVLPYLNGARTPLNNPNAKGLFTGITMDTTAKTLYTALLEAVAIDLSLIVSEIEKSGLEINQLHVSGGGVRNALLLQIIAEVLEKELVAVPPEYDAAAGSAVLSLLSCGEYPDIRKITEKIPVFKRISPTGQHQGHFASKKSTFLQAYQTNIPIFDLISAPNI